MPNLPGACNTRTSSLVIQGINNLNDQNFQPFRILAIWASKKPDIFYPVQIALSLSLSPPHLFTFSYTHTFYSFFSLSFFSCTLLYIFFIFHDRHINSLCTHKSFCTSNGITHMCFRYCTWHNEQQFSMKILPLTLAIESAAHHLMTLNFLGIFSFSMR